MVPTEILKQLQALTRDATSNTLRKWRTAHEEKLAQFSEILERLLTKLTDSPAQKDLHMNAWEELDRAFVKYVDWTQGLHDLDKDSTARVWWEEGRQDFTEALAQFPEQAKILIPQEYWQRQPGDVLRVRWWRWKNRRRLALQRFALSLRNGMRRLLRKEPLSLEPAYREFPLRQFLAFYVETPVAQGVLHEWLRFMQRVALQFDQLHRRNEEIKNDFLFMGEDAASCLQPDPPKVSSRLQKLSAHLQALRAFSSELEQHEAEAVTRLEKSWTDLEPRFVHAWAFAGTAMLPARNYGVANRGEQETALAAQYAAGHHAWRRHLQAEKEEWQQDLVLSRLQLQTAKACGDTVHLLRQKTNKEITPVFQDAIAVLSAALQKFQRNDIKNEAALLEAILTEEASVRRALQQEKLPAMLEAMAKARLDETLADFLAKIEKAIEPLAERHIIFRHRDLHNLTPNSKTDDIPLKELVREEILPELSKKQRLLNGEIREDLERISRSVNEIDQVVEFNLEAAAALLKEGEAEDRIAKARKITVEGLERAVNQINELLRQCEKIVEQSRAALTQNAFAFINRIQDLLDSEKLLALKLRVARARAKERIRQNFKKVWRGLVYALPLIGTYLVTNFRRLKSHYQRLRKVAGLGPATVGIEEKIVQFLTETESQIAALPFVYQRLFRIEPLSDERFFAGRQGNLDIIQKDFEAWQNGRFALLALVGERGSGRTTLLNFAEQEIYQRFTPLKIDISKTTHSEEGLLEYLREVFGEQHAKTLEELERLLLARPEKKICIVENIQNLFLRTVDGFAALERFLLLLTRTHRRVYWVITCTLYSWRYLDKVFRISRFFQRVITLEALTKEEIEAIIMKRHRVSGYRLEFETPAAVTDSRKFKKLASEEERREYLRQLLFEQLNEFASGNVTIAILFWLRAIKQASKDKLVLSPVIEFDHAFLYQLSAEELFTLGALLHHETLTAEQHALVFHQGEQQSALLLNRLHSKGILVVTTNGYVIHPLLYRSMVRVLQTKNILH